MSRVELVKVSASYWKIVHGKRSYGFVRQAENCPHKYVGQYRFGEGEAGKIIKAGNGPEEVFRALIDERNTRYAKQQGFKSQEDLANHNRAVRSRNRRVKSEIFDALNRRDFNKLADILKRDV